MSQSFFFPLAVASWICLFGTCLSQTHRVLFSSLQPPPPQRNTSFLIYVFDRSAPCAELRKSACFHHQGVPPVWCSSRADGIMIMIYYAPAHLCEAEREREVCFRLMCLTPQHLHQAHHKVNWSHTHTHLLYSVCSAFRTCLSLKVWCCIRMRVL